MIVILSGAGLSKESGINTYRDEGGLWNDKDKLKLADFRFWKQNYDILHERINDFKIKQPNLMHFYINNLYKKYNIVHYTQNIDDLMEKTGNQKTIHLHGHFNQFECTNCELVDTVDVLPYICPKCGEKTIKPNVVMFNQPAPLYQNFWQTVKSLKEKDLFIVIGTSNTIIKIHHYTETMPCTTVCVNPVLENENCYDFYVQKNATESIAELDKIIKKTQGNFHWSSLLKR